LVITGAGWAAVTDQVHPHITSQNSISTPLFQAKPPAPAERNNATGMYHVAAVSPWSDNCLLIAAAGSRPGVAAAVTTAG